MKTLLITDSDFGATDRNFEYLLGFQPTFWVMIIGNKKVIIFLDARYFWMTENINKKDIRSKLQNKNLEISYKLLEKWFEEKIAEELWTKKEVNFTDTVTLKYYTKIKGFLKNTKIKIVENILSEYRIIKTTEEKENIAEAITIIDKVYVYILELNNSWGLIWKTERKLQWIIAKKIIEFGGSWESFEALVAFWKNSAVAHHSANETIIDEWVLLIDMWAKYKWYCSDFTRTFWVNPPSQPSPLQEEGVELERAEFKKIYNIVKKAHNHAFENAKAWMSWEEIDALARGIIEESWYAEYFPYSTGHWVWLDIHERPWISKKQENIINDNMVFTIEPWIHLPWRFGIRIEDIVFMENGKLRKMSKSLI